MNKIKAFQQLADLFKSHGFNLYLVGGTVRDYLLDKELDDMDAVTDAKPNEVIAFLNNIDTSFAHLGSLKYKNENGLKFDITTLREESGYIDSRHPSKIIFVKDLKIDYLRRDFTINALYMDENERVIDFYNGEYDLKNHIIRMIGDPDIRIKEDPLRIIRAIRFKITLDFEIEESLLESIKRNKELLKNINKEKIEQDIKKCSNPNKLREYLNELEIL